MSEHDQGIEVVDCLEYQHVDVDPSLWIGDDFRTQFDSEIEGRDILRTSIRKGRLRLQATSYVGVIPINKRLVLRVRPRVPIANLTRMVIETGHDVLPLSTLRDYTGQGPLDEWSLNIYTEALLESVEHVVNEGLWREYKQRADEGHYPHGRVDLQRTIPRFSARGIHNKVAYSWFERSVDISPNRCLKSAMEKAHSRLVNRSARPRRGDRQALSRLTGLLHFFREVSDDHDLSCLEDPRVDGTFELPATRSYYEAALRVARLILLGTGLRLELGGTDIALKSLLIDTNDLFENYIRLHLVRIARERGWDAAVLDGNKDGRADLYHVPSPEPLPTGIPLEALAARDAGAAQPDIVIQHSNGECLLVAEVKNTPHAGGQAVLPSRSEVEQAVTYAVRYGKNFTLLVRPWTDGPKGLLYIGRIGTIDVYDFRLDLSTDDAVERNLSDFADSIAGLAGLAPRPVRVSESSSSPSLRR